MTTTELTVPSVHLNGTGAEDLFKQYADAREAVRTAIEALPVPHGRDYYVQDDGAYARARAEHVARRSMLLAIQEELEQVLHHIAGQRHGARR